MLPTSSAPSGSASSRAPPRASRTFAELLIDCEEDRNAPGGAHRHAEGGRAFLSIRRISVHIHIAVRPPNSGSRDRRYRGDRGGGDRTSLHWPPDKSSSRIGLTSLCTFWDGVRRQTRWLQAWRQCEHRTCLQNRCGGESPQAGSIPVRLRYEIRSLTSRCTRRAAHRPGGSGFGGPRNTGDPHQSSRTSQVFGRSPVLRTGQVFSEVERRAGQVSGVHQRGVGGRPGIRRHLPPAPTQRRSGLGGRQLTAPAGERKGKALARFCDRGAALNDRRISSKSAAVMP